MGDKFRTIRRILFVVLLLNWGVALAKILYGWFTSCASMAADGFHSLSDGASNIIGIIGILAASHPVDKEHPYGHRKYETFAAIGIGVILFLICFNVARNAVLRLIHPVVPDVTVISFGIIVTTLLVNLQVMRYEYRRGKELKSDILIADSHHTRSDILVSLSVIATLICVRLGITVVDAIVAFVIALFIGYTGFEILRRSSGVLCDMAVVPAEDIKKIVIRIPGVKECHDIRTRGREDDIHVDLHLVVDTEMHVDKAHELSHVVEERLKQAIAGISDVVVHIEPIKRG